MNEATANTIVLLFAVALIVFTWLMVKRRFFNGTRHASLPAVHLHAPHPPASPPPAGGPAPAPHPPAAGAHPPQTNPAPVQQATTEAHGHSFSIGPWLKGGLILILFVALFTVAIYLSNFTKADWKGIFTNLPERTENYVLLGLGIAIIMIGALWPKQNTTNEKKGH